MTNDLTELASAYLDGDTPPALRAQVEGDPAALAEVERLRQVRAVLGDIESAPISTRERHLAAALDVWDRLPPSEFTGDATPASAQSAAAAGTASITAPVSLGDRRQRRGSGRVLTIAAAAVIVIGGGIVASSFISSGNDDRNVASQPAPADEELSARAELEVEAAEETFDAAADDSENFAADDAPAAPEAETLAAGESAGPPDEDLEVLSNDDELRVFADDLNKSLAATTDFAAEPTAAETVEAEPAAADSEDAPADDLAEADEGGADEGVAEDSAAQTVPPALSTLPPPADLCGVVTRIVGPALWETEGLFDEAVIIGIDDLTGDAVAYREEDCSVVARTPLVP